MLKDKKYFLFDIDGTLSVDDTLFSGSRELIEYIHSVGGKAFYITNNSVKSRKDYVKKFLRWDILTEENQFMTASYATCRYLREHYRNKKLFVVGTPSFVEELKSFGLCVTEYMQENISCVVVGFDRTLDYRKIETACELLTHPYVDYIGTNPDLRCPTAFGFVPDCGGICKMLEAAVGRKPYFVGKPNPEIVDLCMGQVFADREEVLVVGDRLYTDIACGIRAGVETALVCTGEAKREDVKTTEFVPDYIFDNVEELFHAYRKSLQGSEKSCI